MPSTALSPEDEKGNIAAPSRQMCATWIAEAINEIPRDIIIRSFIHCGLTAPSDYPDMAFPENCAKMEPEELLFADRPEILRAYITGGDMEDEDIHTPPGCLRAVGHPSPPNSVHVAYGCWG